MNRLANKLKAIEPNIDIPIFNVSSQEKKDVPMDSSSGDMSGKQLLSKVICKGNEYDVKRYDEITSDDKFFIVCNKLM